MVLFLLAYFLVRQNGNGKFGTDKVPGAREMSCRPVTFSRKPGAISSDSLEEEEVMLEKGVSGGRVLFRVGVFGGESSSGAFGSGKSSKCWLSILGQIILPLGVKVSGIFSLMSASAISDSDMDNSRRTLSAMWELSKCAPEGGMSAKCSHVISA